MPKLFPIIGVALALVSAPGQLSGQELDAQLPLTVGQRTRITFERWRKPLIGELVSLDSAGVALQLRDGGRPVVLDWAEVAHLDVSVGQRSRGRNVVRGMKYGLATGTAIGGTVVLVTLFSEADERCSDCWLSPTAGSIIVSAIGTAGFTLIGGIVGAAWPTDRWKRIPHEGNRLRLTLRPLPSGGMALAISIGGR